jgi:hypothetical protein
MRGPWIDTEVPVPAPSFTRSIICKTAQSNASREGLTMGYEIKLTKHQKLAIGLFMLTNVAMTFV